MWDPACQYSGLQHGSASDVTLLKDKMPFQPIILSSVLSLSRVWLFVTPWTAAHQVSLSITNSRSLLKLMSIELVMPSNHLILCCSLLIPPSIFPSIRVFSSESVLRIRWPKYWSFSFSISPSNENWGLISFRIDWLDLLAVQGTLKSLLQHHSSKASILWHSAFFIVQHSHPYLTTGKTIALTRQTFISKVMSLLFLFVLFYLFIGHAACGILVLQPGFEPMPLPLGAQSLNHWTTREVPSLLFNVLCSLVIAFLPRSKCLLISWLQSPFAVILEPPRNSVCHSFHCFPIYLPRSDGTGCHDLSFLNLES